MAPHRTTSGRGHSFVTRDLGTVYRPSRVQQNHHQNGYCHHDRSHPPVRITHHLPPARSFVICVTQPGAWPVVPGEPAASPGRRPPKRDESAHSSAPRR